MVWPPANAVTSGIENAIVLPEPVRPRPSTSRPASASGSVAAWIGKGVVIPASASTPVTGAGTPRDAKLTAPAAAATVRRLWRPRWAAPEFSMGRTVKRMSFGLGWPHCLGPPRPWKPVRSPSDVRPARPDGCASLRTVCRQLYRRLATSESCPNCQLRQDDPRWLSPHFVAAAARWAPGPHWSAARTQTAGRLWWWSCG